MVKKKKKDDFKKRHGVNFPGRNLIPHAHKIKLFRADGNIPIDIVGELLGKFFVGNELIQEFFLGQ